jgi:hypothetical protein
MKKEWFTAQELAGAAGLPTTVQAINAKAKRDDWKHQPRKGRGGGREYHLSSLPLETQGWLIKGRASRSRASASSSIPGAPSVAGNAQAELDEFAAKLRGRAREYIQTAEQLLSLADSLTLDNFGDRS